MAMTLEITADSELLHVVASGRFSTDDAERATIEMLDALARHQVEKILFDARKVSGAPDTIQRFLYGDFAARAVARYTLDPGIPPASQFAYVMHEPLLDPARFGEIVATNRGMWVKAFDTVEAALEWLRSGVDSRPDVPV
jgi:hypothetical protein